MVKAGRWTLRDYQLQKYILNISEIKSWQQLRLVLTNTFAFDYDALQEPNDFFMLMNDCVIGDTYITVYGLGKMAEGMPLEASMLRTTFQAIDESHGRLDVDYEHSSAFIRK